MLEVMRNPQIDARRRDQMAAAAAPYVHHRLSSTEHSGPGGSTMQGDGRQTICGSQRCIEAQG
jgi:hypothetical protein